MRDLKSKIKGQSSQNGDQNRKIEGLIGDVHSRDKISKTLENHELNMKNQNQKLLLSKPFWFIGFFYYF